VCVVISVGMIDTGETLLSPLVVCVCVMISVGMIDAGEALLSPLVM